MKTLIIFGLCTLMAMQTRAQTPNFLFSLKATNAQGFKDSAVIGTYINTDTTINYSALIPGLDGPNLASLPADSNMDIRLTNFIDFNTIVTDRRIIPSLCYKPMTSPLSRAVQVYIFIHAKKWPVRLSWDSTLFANTYCVNKSFFSRSNFGLMWDPDSINPENYYAPIHMAALHGNLKLDSMPAENQYSPWLYKMSSWTPLNGGKPVQYYAISIFLNRRLGGANGPGGGVSVKPKKQFSLKIYPNPVDNQFTIEHNLLLGKIMIVKIFNMQGQMVDSRSISRAANSHIIMTGHLPAGMYMVEMQESGVSLVSRAAFVKL